MSSIGELAQATSMLHVNGSIFAFQIPAPAWERIHACACIGLLAMHAQ